MLQATMAQCKLMNMSDYKHAATKAVILSLV